MTSVDKPASASGPDWLRSTAGPGDRALFAPRVRTAAAQLSAWRSGAESKYGSSHLELGSRLSATRDGFPNPPTTNPVEHFDLLEQAWINDRLHVVNRVIHDSIDESGVAQYVDVENAFNGHELDNTTPVWPVDSNGVATCNGPGAYMNGIDLLAAQGQNRKVEEMHPNPCGQLAFANTIMSNAALGPSGPITQSPVDTFSIAARASHTTSVIVNPGQRNVEITARWRTGMLTGTVTPPGGGTPVLPTLGSSGGKAFATWILVPASQCLTCYVQTGTWTVNLTNITNNGRQPGDPLYDLGVVEGEVDAFQPSTVPALPPAAVVYPLKHSGPIGCDATFRASVAQSLQSSVASFTWYDDHGNQQSSTTNKISGDTMEMSSLQNSFTFIVKALGADGETRYTVISSRSVC